MVKVFTPAYGTMLWANGVPRCDKRESAIVYYSPKDRAKLQALTNEYAAMGVDGIATHTFRCSPDFVGEDVDRFNRLAVKIAQKAKKHSPVQNVQIFGTIGPIGRNTYRALPPYITESEIMAYHTPQAKALKEEGVHRLHCETLGDKREGAAIAKLSRDIGVPLSISFALDQDGNLRDGTSFSDAIHYIDSQTQSYPLSYMCNCSSIHWIGKAFSKLDFHAQERVGGFYPNASHADPLTLEGSNELITGTSVQQVYNFLQKILTENPSIKDTQEKPFWVSGCCGFSHDLGDLVQKLNGEKQVGKLKNSGIALVSQF